MKFKIEFDTDTKKFAFYIDDQEAQYDSCSIEKCFSTLPESFNGIEVEYKKTEGEKEECHEITYDSSTGLVTHYEGYTSNLVPNKEPGPEEQKQEFENNLDKLFRDKKIRETTIDNLIPEPGKSLAPENDQGYLPVFKN